jgi:hypothetical protein
MSLIQINPVSVQCVSILAAFLLLDFVHAGAFVWGEYAASNDLDPNAMLSPTSWVATRCSRFKGESTYPNQKKCSDGRDCLDGVPCTDGEPCICNDGKKDTTNHLGFTGNEEVLAHFHLMQHTCSMNNKFTSLVIHLDTCPLQLCVTATPCQFQVIDPQLVADCLPECDTLTRNSLMQLTDKIAFSCDYSSFQSILNCGNCVLALCEFENRFNPEAKSCIANYYNEIWPCYRKHFSE